MAISAALVTSRVVVCEAKVRPVPPPDPFCYGLCSNTFKDAECHAVCQAKKLSGGHCIFQTEKLRCCCSIPDRVNNALRSHQP
ncbi:hypothetical protein ACFX2H_010383 [Malus domestica]